MTRRRRWLLAIVAMVLIGAATPIVVVLLPCETRAVVLLNATRWAAQVTLQIEISETGPRYTVWSGTVESQVRPLRVPIAAPGLAGEFWVTVHFPETGQSIPELPFGYTVGFASPVEFLLIRDEDIVHAFWHDPPLTDEPMGLWSNLWDAAILLLSSISCLDGS